MELIRLEIPELFISCLNASLNNNDTIHVGLICISEFLEFSKRKLDGIMVQAFYELDIVKYLEDLSINEVKDISSLAINLLNSYFKSVEDVKAD